MSMFEFFGSLIFLGLALGSALAVFFLLRGPSRRLLQASPRLGLAQPFYTRVLLVMVVLVAIGIAGGRVFTLPPGAAFMEYVWQAAGNLNSVLGYLAVVIAGYAAVLMVLTVGLRNDK